MRPNQIEDDDEEEFRGPSKSHLKRVQNELQELGRVMTGMGDETLKKIGLPEAVRPRPDLQRRHQESGQDPGAGLMWG